MSSTYSNLKIELIGTGDQSGTWGTTTNTNLGTAIEEAITGSATVSFSSADVTLTLTNTNTAQTARNLRLNLTGTSGGARNLTVPNIEKYYIIANDLADTVTVKNSSGATYGIPAGTTAQVFSTGTGITDAISFFDGAIISPVAVITGGAIDSTTIGATTATSGKFTTLSATGALTYGGVTLSNAVTGTGNMVLSASPTLTGAPLAPTAAPGTNTTQIATTAFVTNVAGSLGTMSSQNANAVAITGGTVGGLTTFNTAGTTTIGETTTVSATAATGTVNYDVITQGVLYYTSSASGNWTVNFRGNSSTSLNTLMAIGETRATTFLVTQGATAYYNSAVTIDGASVTPKWQGGVTPSSGNTSSIDVYTYTIIKTASATYTVLASVTKFA